MSTTAYETSPIKRIRRTKSAIAEMKADIYAIVEEVQPATVRQVYYQAVTRGVIEKTENAYKSLCRLLGEMRMDENLPWQWIADNTRWMRKPRTFDGVEDALRNTTRTYRHNLWQDNDAYVEIWLEKDALSGVLCDVTWNYDVPLMVSKGFASLSYIHDSAMTIADCGKPAYIYYFGDHDPSGVAIDRSIERRMREFAPDADLHFERVAVKEEQIEEWNLPTRPTKKSDSRAKTFKGESVEVDAIPPVKLKELVHDCIHRHLDPAEYNRLRMVEKAERNTIAQLEAYFIQERDK